MLKTIYNLKYLLPIKLMALKIMINQLKSFQSQKLEIYQSFKNWLNPKICYKVGIHLNLILKNSYQVF